MLSNADEKSTLILVLSILIIILICGVLAIDTFNRHSFKQSSLELITNQQIQISGAN